MEMFYLTRLPKSAGEGVAEPTWIQLAPYGTWKPYGQDLSVTPEMASRMVENFKNGIRGHEIETDYDHKMDKAKGNKASGWIRDVEARTDGLWGLVDWTETARQEIHAGEWKYFSMDWHPAWKHPTTGVVYNDVIFGGGLTNRPQHKGRLPINASELLWETDMGNDDTHTEPAGQKQDQADPNNPLDPNTQQPKAPTHKEPNTAGDNPSPIHPADDDPSADAGFMERLRKWVGTNADNIDKSDSPQEGDVVKLDVIRTKLDLPDDADDDAIIAKLDSVIAEVEPLRKVAAEIEAGSKFASEYPEQHKRIITLEQEGRVRRASEFAAQFTDLGDGRGLSTTAREKIENAYLASESGGISTEDLAEVLATVTDKEHIVDYKEHGSSQAAELVEPGVDSFLAKIKEIQAAENLSYPDAMRKTASEHPELAKAYQDHFSSVKGGDN